MPCTVDLPDNYTYRPGILPQYPYEVPLGSTMGVFCSPGYQSTQGTSVFFKCMAQSHSVTYTKEVMQQQLQQLGLEFPQCSGMSDVPKGTAPCALWWHRLSVAEGIE